MGYLDELRSFVSQNAPDEAPTKPTKGGSVSFDSAPTGRFLKDARELMKAYRAALAGQDCEVPQHGLEPSRWRELLRDTGWLLDNFAAQAFRDGWTVGELFGRWPDKDGCGGIADRLQGSRSLKMTADRAHWRCAVTGQAMQFNRTAYPDLCPLWENVK